VHCPHFGLRLSAVNPALRSLSLLPDVVRHYCIAARHVPCARAHTLHPCHCTRAGTSSARPPPLVPALPVHRRAHARAAACARRVFACFGRVPHRDLVFYSRLRVADADRLPYSAHAGPPCQARDKVTWRHYGLPQPPTRPAPVFCVVVHGPSPAVRVRSVRLFRPFACHFVFAPATRACPFSFVAVAFITSNAPVTLVAAPLRVKRVLFGAARESAHMIAPITLCLSSRTEASSHSSSSYISSDILPLRARNSLYPLFTAHSTSGRSTRRSPLRSTSAATSWCQLSS
jgi:hypothetical protein